MLLLTKGEKVYKEVANRYNKLLHDVLIRYNKTDASTQNVILIYALAIVCSLDWCFDCTIQVINSQLYT